MSSSMFKNHVTDEVYQNKIENGLFLYKNRLES